MTGTSDLPYASLEKALQKLHHLGALLNLQKQFGIELRVLLTENGTRRVELLRA